MSRKPSSASHAESEPREELNLSPIMALLVILIPMLLAMFNFFEVKVQAVAAPKLFPGGHVVDGAEPLDLTVTISERGFALKARNEPEMRPIPRTEPDGYDYATLYSQLRELKQRHPAERTIHLAAEMDIPWHIIARTLDAARVELEQPRYEGRDRTERFASASPVMKAAQRDIDGDGAVTAADREAVEMFPRVVFVVADN